MAEYMTEICYIGERDGMALVKSIKIYEWIKEDTRKLKIILYERPVENKRKDG